MRNIQLVPVNIFEKVVKIFLAVILTSFFIGHFFTSPALAENNNSSNKDGEEKITIYFFDDRLCLTCKSTKEFIQKILPDYPKASLKIYPISDTKKLAEIAEKHGVKNYQIMAPTIFIGDNFFQFRDFTTQHEEMIIQALKGEVVEEDCCIIKIPLINIEVDIRGWSLPFITVVLGSLDGLNVCSIGALILIISIVMVFNSRKKIFLFGGLFILTAAVIYGTLVFVWGKAFEMLVGQLEILRIIVGLAALAGGIYFLREFLRFLKYGPACKSSHSKLTQGATLKLQNAFKNPQKGFLFLAASIMFFAAIITIVELPCSIGIPIAFTGILAEKSLPLASYTFYILIYLLFYMLIEIVVFVGAVFTKKIWFAGSKLITWTTFLGAAVLLYLAFYYLIGF